MVLPSGSPISSVVATKNCREPQLLYLSDGCGGETAVIVGQKVAPVDSEPGLRFRERARYFLNDFGVPHSVILQ